MKPVKLFITEGQTVPVEIPDTGTYADVLAAVHRMGYDPDHHWRSVLIGNYLLPIDSHLLNLRAPQEGGTVFFSQLGANFEAKLTIIDGDFSKEVTVALAAHYRLGDLIAMIGCQPSDFAKIEVNGQAADIDRKVEPDDRVTLTFKEG